MNPGATPVKGIPVAADSQSWFSRRIVAWQKRAGRHALPWQNTSDPYRVWLSEIMLQQTQVKTVIPYYERFLHEFPTLDSLASAPLERVLGCWSGLGYYSRARNLHACAQQVTRDHGGVFPQNIAELESLSGVGRSTAAAVRAFAFGQRATILDGNVKRVLCRSFGIEGYPGSGPVLRQLWDLAETLTPTREIRAYSQGLMDLGAEVCTPRRPHCDQCPLADSCAARLQGRVDELPKRRALRVVPKRRVGMLVLQHANEVLLYRKPDDGIWGGLWSFPEFECEARPTRAVSIAACHGTPGTAIRLAPIVHAFTHFQLTMEIVLIVLIERVDVENRRGIPHIWMRLGDVSGAALPAPVKRALEALRDGHHVAPQPLGPV